MAPYLSRWVRATLLLGIVVRASAADTNTQVAPEMYAYLDLSDRVRLFFLSSFTDNITNDARSETVGVHIDIALKPIIQRRLRVADWARKKYLFVRVGYLRSFGSKTPETGAVEAYSRFPLPLGLMVVSRLRTDLRNETGGFSVRPRYRLHFEREIPVGQLTATPYVRAEVLYDSRPSTWNWRYQAGVEIALTRHWRIEPYYARWQNQHSADINRIGFIVKTFW
jgi:hypothetical protein